MGPWKPTPLPPQFWNKFNYGGTIDTKSPPTHTSLCKNTHQPVKFYRYPFVERGQKAQDEVHFLPPFNKTNTNVKSFSSLPLPPPPLTSKSTLTSNLSHHPLFHHHLLLHWLSWPQLCCLLRCPRTGKWKENRLQTRHLISWHPISTVRPIHHFTGTHIWGFGVPAKGVFFCPVRILTVDNETWLARCDPRFVPPLWPYTWVC